MAPGDGNAGALPSASTTRCAVRLGESAEEQRALDHFLADCGLTTDAVFAAKDDDELNQQACDGRFGVIIFPTLDALLNAIWKGDADVERWMNAGVKLELAKQPLDDKSDWPLTGRGSVKGWRAFVGHVSKSHIRWKSRNRRRQIIAALILSVIALIAVAVLFSLVPSPR